MIAKLVAEEGEAKGLVLSFEEGVEWIIGRDPNECQLVIPDALVSRKHLLARLTPQGIAVENLSQTNPVAINEEEIGTESHILNHGDTIKIGSGTFRYYTDPSAHIVDVGDDNLVEPIDASDTFDEPQTPFSAAPTPPNQSADNSSSDTIFFDERDSTGPALAEINFGLLESGRWLLKVIGGPNNGAEFYMQANHEYIIGTDPQTCDIVFHDTSVSRQHAKITVTQDDQLMIEDLKSRNGTLVNNQPVISQQNYSQGSIVTVGTTSFAIYDREGEMQTIVSPLILPSASQSLSSDIGKETSGDPLNPSVEPGKEVINTPANADRKFNRLIFFIVTGSFLLFGSLGLISLFNTENVTVEVEKNAIPMIEEAIKPFPSVHYSFNKNNGNLLLIGHLSTASQKTELRHQLGALDFIKHIDDTGIVIDEGAAKEINSILAKDNIWQGITVSSPEPGEFIVSGRLKTRKQAEQLSTYLSLQFPYLNLLTKQLVVEEDIMDQIYNYLQEAHITNVTATVANGEVTLNGKITRGQEKAFEEALAKIKNISGIHSIQNTIRTQAIEKISDDLTTQYQVSGQSRINNKRAVVINGRILSEGDILDNAYEIEKITPNQVLLEKDGLKYHIDY